MQKYIKSLLVLLTIIAIQGCATHQKFINKYNTWIGKDISQFINQVGYPDSTFTLPNKNKVYIYEKNNLYSMSTIMPMMGYGYGRFHHGGFGISYGSEVVQETCKVFIEVNKKGKILKWDSRGNHCISQ